MRILHVITRLATVDGGPPAGLVTLARAQAKSGDQVILLPCSSSGGAMVMNPGVYDNLTVLEPPTATNLKLPSTALRTTIDKAAHGMDIIHIHGTWRYHLIAAAKAAEKLHIPYIIRPAGDLGRIPRRSKAFLKWPYFRIVEKPFFQRADAIHCTSRQELGELEDLKLKARTFVVPQPIDDSLLNVEPDFDMLQQLCPGLNDNPMLLYLGRISWIKRLPILAEAFIAISKDFPTAHLVVAGPWEDKAIVDEIQNKARMANIVDRVHFPGMVRGGIKAALLRRTTAFVLPSDHENFGISAAEALLFGKSCIISSGVGLASDISAANAGVVFSGGTVMLAEAISMLLTKPGFIDSCNCNAAQLANSFMPATVANQLRKEYEMCIRH